MATHSRTIQIRVREFGTSEPSSNVGIAFVTRVQKNDRLWFLYYPKNGDESLKAVFTDESPLEGGANNIPLEKLSAEAQEGEGATAGVKVTADAGPKAYHYEIRAEGKPTGLVAGQIDIDP